MPQYFFILGRNPTLSAAEIITVLHTGKISSTVDLLSPEVLVISTEGNISPKMLIKTLGGTIKIGKIVQEAGLDEDESKFQKIFEAHNIVDNFLATKDGKLHFGISIYDGGADRRYLSEITNQLKSLSINVKENLKNEGLKAGFVRIKERYLSSVSVWKNELLTKGTEIVLILTGQKIMAGKTMVVQEFESFSFRDYGRPQRDTRSGIMPPKLARMMINFAVSSSDGVLLDPFCGSGTIIQEAIMLGYKNITGTDISRHAVSDTQKNVDWLFANFRNLDRTKYNIEIYQSDIKLIGERVKPESVDMIVSEPYLGPPLYKQPAINEVQRIFAEVEKLYLDAFREFYKVLKKGGKVVFIFPAFEINGKMHFVSILDKIKGTDFVQKEYFPEELKTNRTIQLTPRGTILYGSREQFVKREIISLQKS